MQNPDFYLASTEHRCISVPRKCFKIRRIKNGDIKRDDFLLIKVSPSIKGFSHKVKNKKNHEVLIASRHVGDTLYPIKEWPIHVYVCIPNKSFLDNNQTFITNKDYNLEFWGKLYKDEKSALADTKDIRENPDDFIVLDKGKSKN